MLKPDRNLFRFDKHSLPEEWEEQAERFYDLSEKLADARAEYERLKARKDVIYAELELEIRNDPLKHNLQKITESAVNATITCNSKYQTITERLIRAKHAVDTLQGAVTALEHKKKGMEMNTSLLLGGMYAEPQIPKRIRETFEMSEYERRFGSPEKKKKIKFKKKDDP